MRLFPVGFTHVVRRDGVSLQLEAPLESGEAMGEATITFTNPDAASAAAHWLQVAAARARELPPPPAPGS